MAVNPLKKVVGGVSWENLQIKIQGCSINFNMVCSHLINSSRFGSRLDVQQICTNPIKASQPEHTDLQHVDQRQTRLAVEGVGDPAIRAGIRVSGLNLCHQRTFGHVRFDAHAVFHGSEARSIIVLIRQNHPHAAKGSAALEKKNMPINLVCI